MFFGGRFWWSQKNAPNARASRQGLKALHRECVPQEP
jgi:hypothetical protein